MSYKQEDFRIIYFLMKEYKKRKKKMRSLYFKWIENKKKILFRF